MKCKCIIRAIVWVLRVRWHVGMCVVNSFSITETSVNFFRLFVDQAAISLVEYYVVVVVAICYAQSAVWMAKMLLNVNS